MSKRIGVLMLAALGCTVTPADPLPAAPTIAAFAVSPAVIQPGTPVKVTWATENASHVTITDAQGTALTGVNDQASGSLDVSPSAPTVLLLTASNDRGVKAIHVASVTVEGVGGSVLFSAHPSVLEAGEAATLLWSAPGARSVVLTDENGMPIDLQGQTSSGAVQVNPAEETTYVLNADGARRRVTVSRRALIESLTLSSPTAKPQDTVTLRWQTKHASKVSVTVAGRGELFAKTGAEAAAGQFDDTVPTIPPGGLVSYVFRAEGQGAAVEQRVVLQVGSAPDILSLDAPLYARSGGLFNVKWTTKNAEGLQISSQGQVLYATANLDAIRTGQVWLVSPSAPLTYQLKASRGGASAERSFTVAPVGTASIATFTALPATINAGGSPVTLSWSVPNARHLRVLANNEYTVASARGTAAEMGTVTVYPNAATTYVLSADNGVDAPLTANQTVTVTAPADFGPAGAGPLFAGSTVALEWSAPGGGMPAMMVGFPHEQVSSTALMTPGFEDIASTGTQLTFANRDDGQAVVLPADFETFVYGARVGDRVTISVNGALTLTGSNTLPNTAGELPGTSRPVFLAAPFWADLELGSGNVYWQMVNEAPERTLVVQWNKVKVKAVPTSELTFQARVHQSGVITFEYPQIDGTNATRAVGVTGPEDVLVGSAVEGQRVTFFGPRASPLPYGLQNSNTAKGFLKLSNGYLPVVFAPAARLVANSSLFFSEALYQPAAAVSASGEWLEVRNTANVPIDLDGWHLDFGAGNVHTLTPSNGSTVVPAGGTLVLGQAASSAANDNVAVQYVYGTTEAMPDGPGTVVLSSDAGFSTTLQWDNAVSGNGSAGVSVVHDLGPLIFSTDTGTAPSPHSLNCDSTQSFGTHGQQGSPGSPSGCFAYRLEPRPAAYRDISTTGTRVISASSPLAPGIIGNDENWAAVSLVAAPVPYFGAPINTLYVAANGWVSVSLPGNSITDNYSNKGKPDPSRTPSGVFAPFWDDLEFADDPASGIYSQRFAAGADANELRPHWVIQWHRFTHYGLSAPDDLNFEVKFFDDGDIEVHYGTMSSGDTSRYGTGSSATIWLENLLGTQALMVDPRTTPIRPQSAYRFRPQ
ncbi:MAG: lamin tail domain-containing protein [Myxococcaceae bacterium]|nr:lamin tail domain-containing protein [Myxococcaceae bacterium]